MDILIFLPIAIVVIWFIAIYKIESSFTKDEKALDDAQMKLVESIVKFDEAYERGMKVKQRRSSGFEKVKSLDDNHIRYDRGLVEKYITDAHNPELPIDDREKAIDGLCDYIDTIYFYNK